MKTIIDKGYGKGLLLELKEFKGSKFLSLMELWKKEENEDWKFSKKNITVNATTLKQFLEFIDENRQELIDEIGFKELKTPKDMDED